MACTRIRMGAKATGLRFRTGRNTTTHITGHQTKIRFICASTYCQIGTGSRTETIHNAGRNFGTENPYGTLFAHVSIS